MITEAEYKIFNAHGCADYTGEDEAKGRVALAHALETATNTDEQRVASAQTAFTHAAHYARLAKFPGINDYAFSYAQESVEFWNLRARLLLTERTASQIKGECKALLRKHEEKWQAEGPKPMFGDDD
jgi:hypothetical protein